MKMRLVAPIVALIAVGSVAVAQGAKEQPMSPEEALEKAIELHRSGEFDPNNNNEHADAVELVQQDIKACLTFYEPTECTGPAETWVQGWNALELPLPSAQNSTVTQPSALPQPSLLQLHAPFTKSAVDYYFKIAFPSVGAAQ